jgi:hypothetical protein
MFLNNMAPNNMAQRFKMTGFVFNIFIIMIQYIIIINSSDKINIMKQHIGKIDENKTNYNFEDRFDKFDNFVIKMVIKTVDYIHNKITEQPTINALPTNPPPIVSPPIVSPPPTDHPPTINHQINQPINNFNKITHLIPHYDYDNLDHNEILHNGWCPLCACKKSKSDLCKGISSIMYSLIINFEGVCSLCPIQYLIDVEEHINMDSAFISKDLKDVSKSSLFNAVEYLKPNCNEVFTQSFYKELKSSAIYTEMIGCINNPKSNYHINEYITEVKSLFVIRWFWLKYENIFYKNRFQHYFFRQHLDHDILGDDYDYLKKILSNQALLFSIDGKILNPT